MLRVGLTGGLACGKSFVGEALKDLGCHLVQADDLGHEVLEPGGAAYDGVVRAFGTGILSPDGAIDRRKLAHEVFGQPERLLQLSELVHPPVIRREEEMIAEFAAHDPHGIVVVEAAILIETGSHKRFEKIVLVMCKEGQQIERAMRRDRADLNEVLARLRRQMPLEEKRRYADYVIDASGSKEETLRQVEETYHSLRSIAR